MPLIEREPESKKEKKIKLKWTMINIVVLLLMLFLWFMAISFFEVSGAAFYLSLFICALSVNFIVNALQKNELKQSGIEIKENTSAEKKIKRKYNLISCIAEIIYMVISLFIYTVFQLKGFFPLAVMSIIIVVIMIIFARLCQKEIDELNQNQRKK